MRHTEAVAELKDLKEELAEVRMVAEGALARREVLETQIKRAREQVKQLLAKSDDDDSLIRTLHGRLTAQGNRWAAVRAQFWLPIMALPGPYRPRNST